MSADAVAEMSPLIREVLGTEVSMCATFTAKQQSAAWLQVMRGGLNVAYPPADAAGIVLKAAMDLLPGCTVTTWEPGRFATLSFGNRAVPTHRPCRGHDPQGTLLTGGLFRRCSDSGDG